MGDEQASTWDKMADLGQGSGFMGMAVAAWEAVRG